MIETLKLPHKVLDYACPINGLEDQYEWKTGVRLPGYGLMDLANLGFTYLKQKNAPAPRMVFWGSGMGKPIFSFLADVIGFEWCCLEGKGFNPAWKTALEELEKGVPVLLGILDMYHLHYYPKFYHRIHIPQHYVLLVGFDEPNQAALVQDNGLSGVQSIPLSDLRLAWNVSVPGQGKPNTLFTIRFSETPASPETIWRKGLKKRAGIYLHPPVGFLGVKGIRKAQKEIAAWQNELGDSAWKESLRSLATFTCSAVPNLPQALLPYPLGYEDAHQACRDRFSSELVEAAGEFHERSWLKAAELFGQSGGQIAKLTEVTVAALSGRPQAFAESAVILERIADLEEEAFTQLL